MTSAIIWAFAVHSSSKLSTSAQLTLHFPCSFLVESPVLEEDVPLRGVWAQTRDELLSHVFHPVMDDEPLVDLEDVYRTFGKMA